MKTEKEIKADVVDEIDRLIDLIVRSPARLSPDRNSLRAAVMQCFINISDEVRNED